MKNRCGFTLVELMFCVAIIGILATIAIPNFSGFRAAGQVTEAFTIARSLQVAVSEYYAHTGTFPKDNAALGVPAAKELMGARIEKIDVENGALHISFMHNSINADFIINQDLLDEDELQAVISIRPAIVSDPQGVGSISWLCGQTQPLATMQDFGENRTNIKASILPTTCL